jgi:hypothetical protein
LSKQRTSPIPCDQSGITTKFRNDDSRPGYSLYDVSIPLGTVPGYGRFPNLFGTFLRVAYTDASFANIKELSAGRSHGVRNFHQPQRFLSISLPGGASPPVAAAPAPAPAPRVDSSSTVCVTDRALAAAAQNALIQKGLLPAGSADGAFGNRSLAALSAWLTRNNLPAVSCLTESVRQLLLASN